jgi:hypothetical protein
VGVLELNDWESSFDEIHEGHAEPDEDWDWGPDVCFGPLPDYDPEEDGPQRPDVLLRCCGQDRPRKKGHLRLTVEAAGDFLTVHEYVSAVHPWLMSMVDDIREAYELMYASPPETTLLVDFTTPNYLMMEIPNSVPIPDQPAPPASLHPSWLSVYHINGPPGPSQADLNNA